MIGGLSILIMLVVAAGFLVNSYIRRKPPEKKISTVSDFPVSKKPVRKIPKYEVFPRENGKDQKPDVKQKVPLAKELPLVSIIIDDLGYDKAAAKNFLALDAPLTFSIFPHSPFKVSIIEKARSKGIEIMLHLPMEPIEYPSVDPGPGALLMSMSPDELIGMLNENLDNVPFISGVNNHMGSKMMSASSQMYQIFSILKKRNLFFVDSRTSPDTLARPSAGLFQVPFAERDVFLDHINSSDFVRKQIKKLILVAERNGEAIGIGHPYKATYQVLRDALPDLRKKVKLVPASALARPAG